MSQDPITPPPDARSAPTVLRLSGITKRFGPLLANDDISLQLARGEVLALLGENGAGKSTLMSILFGHYVADAGHIEAFGAPLPPGNPRAALAAGIGMVHQHFTLADNLSVLDNVMLGSESLAQPFTRRAAAREKLVAVGQQFGLTVDPAARVGDLSVGERQRVEILKALYRGARILILDEPTAVLTPQESEALFDTLGQMVAQGLSIIFISHKLGEVLRVSHRVAVLRAGRLVAECAAADTSEGQLAEWMVGHAVARRARQPAAAVGEVVAELADVHTAGSARERLRGVSLGLRAGEIVAIAGVSGNGQVPLAQLLSGLRVPTQGQARVLGQPVKASAAGLAARGIARIPEDRAGVGVVGDLPVWENAVAERIGSAHFANALGWVRRRAARAYATHVSQRFDVRGGGLDAPARALSGGNMQKLILGRALTPPGATEHRAQRLAAGPPQGEAAPSGGSEPREAGSVGVPRLVVAHQPTWGLDIGAVDFVQQQLIAARDAGAAVLVISDDLDEVLTLGDRIAVMHGGQLTEARPAEVWTRSEIGLDMAGASAGAVAGVSTSQAVVA